MTAKELLKELSKKMYSVNGADVGYYNSDGEWIDLGGISWDEDGERNRIVLDIEESGEE